MDQSGIVRLEGQKLKQSLSELDNNLVVQDLGEPVCRVVACVEAAPRLFSRDGAIGSPRR
jgi:hypothetical protein